MHLEIEQKFWKSSVHIFVFHQVLLLETRLPAIETLFLNIMTSMAALTLSPSVVVGRQRCGTSNAAPSLGATRCLGHRPLRSSMVARAATPEAKPDPFATKEVYHDNAFDKVMISYFSKTMSDRLGGKPYDGTYDAFVELSREIMRGRNTKQQQEAVDGVLASLLPPQSPERFRKWFPLSRRNAEFNAWITTLGFTWLVGPSELNEVEVEFEGKKETWRSGVKIKKCRYLENSGCVGMCVK